MKQEIDPDYEVNWYRIAVPGPTLMELNRRSDAQGVFQAFGCLALMMGTAVVAVWTWQHLAWGWLLVALYVHGTVAAFCINAVHELVHGTVFETKPLNTFYCAIFSFIGWINPMAFWSSHAEHHRYTLHDPHDQEVVVPIELTPGGFLRSFFDPIAPKYVVQHHWGFACGKLPDDWHHHVLDDSPDEWKVYAWSRCILAGHVLLASASLAMGWWLLPVLLSLTPMYGRTLFFLMNNTQHIGLQDHVNDFRLNSRTFHVNPLFQFLYWHMNYHIEHHMYAGVPCYNLKKLHRMIEHEMPYTWNGLVDMWRHILMVMKRQKQDPAYVYIPDLPGRPVTSGGNQDRKAA